MGTTSVVITQQSSSMLDEASRREWLVTDGLGGFAMGTVGGLRTRRYHGLLVPATQPPLGRMLALVSLDPILILADGSRIGLGVHEWAGGAIDPQGYRHLVRFDLTDGLPRWRWQVGDLVLERELAMTHGRSGVAVVHRLLAGGPARLELTALTTWRDAHGERHASGDLAQQDLPEGAVLEQSFRLHGPAWAPVRRWYRGAHARLEAERGLASDEDFWCAGTFSAELCPGEDLAVSAWAGDLDDLPPDPGRVIASARERSLQLIKLAGADDDVVATLVLAADSFIVCRPDPGAEAGSVPDVVAGYPWFGAWTRDTMTSYEGLFLSTGRAAEGRELLLGYARTISEGMLANTADTGSTEYNTVDGTLWFAHAVGRHVEGTGDNELSIALLPTLDQIVAAHLAGTRFGIGVDQQDGLLRQGAPGYALTWMDARVDGIGVTARIGKPVEVNALWIRTLEVTAACRRVAGRDDTDLRTAAGTARASFLRRFAAPTGWLHDVVDGPAGDDPTLRPNQLLALSLPGTPLVDDSLADAVIAAVGRELLTPLGLRSLHPGGQDYRGRHRGGPAERDAAYHQGTVWPWLLGPYIDALLRHGHTVDGALDAAVGHLHDWGLGSVSETADGEPPHAGTGCPFQAWSVAELLRVVKRLRDNMHQPDVTSRTFDPDDVTDRSAQR
jgi:predicted glycogen debranching enzyme